MGEFSMGEPTAAPRVSSSCVYSQCAVHTAMGPCAKGHFIHAGTNGPGVPLLLLLLCLTCRSNLAGKLKDTLQWQDWRPT
jgi:hypothetical protein